MMEKVKSENSRFDNCEILSEKLEQNGFENRFVTLWNNGQKVKKYILFERVEFCGQLTPKMNSVHVSSTPESMDDFIDLMILQKVD